MKRGKKLRRRLDRRVSDFLKGSQSNEAKVSNRWNNGGYHKPGSFNK